MAGNSFNLHLEIRRSPRRIIMETKHGVMHLAPMTPVAWVTMAGDEFPVLVWSDDAGYLELT